MKKPDPRIYKVTLDRYAVTASNAVFIDDKLENVNAAIQLGIHGIHFTTAAKLKKDLDAFGVS